MLNYKIYLEQIKKMIGRLEDSTKNISLKKFSKDDVLFDATVLRLQVIGESIKSVSLEVKKKNKQVKWKLFSKLRNFLSHKYIQVDKEIIYNLVKKEIPQLKEQINTVK